MKRALFAACLAALFLPELADASASCAVAEQRDPKALISHFLQQDISATPRGEYVKWDNAAAGYKGSEYVYPIENPRLEQDSLMVVSELTIKEIKTKGADATAVVELFTIADVWRPKGREEDAFARRLTEIGEPLLQSYQLRREQGCWLLVNPPKPVVKARTVLSYLEQMLADNRSQPAEEVTPESRKRAYVLEREVPMLKNLIRKYVPGAGV